METLDQVIEKHETKFPAICELYQWSQNYEFPSPMSYFLDLIGYSKNEFDDTLGDWQNVTDKINLWELAYIADALLEYTKNSEPAYEAIKELVDFGG